MEHHEQSGQQSQEFAEYLNQFFHVIFPTHSMIFFSLSEYHCLLCQKVFTSASSLRRHLGTANSHVACQEPSHEHHFIQETFSDMETAKAWVLAKELDQTFNIVLSKPNYVLYNCRYRKARDSAASVQGDRPLKRRKKTSKPVYNCPAKFIIDKSVVCSCDEVIGSTECQNYCEMVRLRGCTTHSHDLEIRHQRLSKVTKDTLKTLLKSGVPKATILNQYCSSNSFETESKLITMQDLVNLERLDVRGDDNLSEFENVCVEMERKEFRAVSFQGRTHPPIPKVIQSKLIETNGKSMIIYASDTMLDQFRQHPHTLFIVDVTKRKKIPLMTLMVKGISTLQNDGMDVLYLKNELCF